MAGHTGSASLPHCSCSFFSPEGGHGDGWLPQARHAAARSSGVPPGDAAAQELERRSRAGLAGDSPRAEPGTPSFSLLYRLTNPPPSRGGHRATRIKQSPEHLEESRAAVQTEVCTCIFKAARFAAAPEGE